MTVYYISVFNEMWFNEWKSECDYYKYLNECGCGGEHEELALGERARKH